VHYELALALVALAIAAYAAVARSPLGAQLAAVRDRPAAASALGVPAARLRLGAFVASAAVGGLAGALAVQLAGVTDPGANGPFRSFQLFVAVLLGGAAAAGGGLVGISVLGLLGLAAGAVARLENVPPERFETMLAAGFLLTVLATGTDGIIPWLRDRLRRRSRPDTFINGSDPFKSLLETRPAPLLAANGLRKRFGGVVAVDGLSLELEGGRISALVGPNGSGKTTALRLVSGALEPDEGSVVLDGRPLPVHERERALAGVVRTLQGTAIFPRLTALENALVGAAVRAHPVGPFRTVFATPQARAAGARARAQASAALELAGLEGAANEPASQLDAGEARALMLANALATEPRVLLVDEPAAGAGPEDVRRLAHVLLRLRARGLALLIVEHDLRLVRRVADWVVVLDAGAVIASGTPDEVARDPAVREAYLGRSRL
jgi:branched-chain amino acid transport system permease protein